MRPDFIIIGAPKCGTTSLYRYLNGHPSVYFSLEKEPHYFSYAGEKHPRWATSTWKEYQSLFSHAASDQLTGEASTWYLYSTTAAEEIKRRCPHTRCIALLRHPVDRAYSNWSFRVANGWESLSFEEAVYRESERIHSGAPWDTHYLHAGLYADQIERYLHHLGPDQLRIYLFDDLKNDAMAVVKDCLRFLSLSPEISTDTNQVHNSTKMPRSEKLQSWIHGSNPLKSAVRDVLPKTMWTALSSMVWRVNTHDRPALDSNFRGELIDFFTDDLRRLESLINRDLSHWL